MPPRVDPARLRLESYPMRHEIRARFGDVDSLRHVNNVAIAGYYEDARVAVHRQLVGGLIGRGIRVLSARIDIQYFAEVHYPGTFQIGVGLAGLGRTSFTVAEGLFSGDRCLGICDTVLVHANSDGPVPLSDEVRSALERSRLRA